MTENQHNDVQEKLLSELFENASPRPQPPEGVREEAFGALHGEWQALVQQRKRRARVSQFAAAAAVLVAAFLALRAFDEPAVSTLEPVASVQRVVGDTVTLNGGSIVESAVLAPGDALLTGAASMIALNWHGGASLRIAESSEITIVSDGAVRLVSGALYFDSQQFGQVHDPELQFMVETALGRVSHVGTQFMLRVQPDDIDVSVREGEIKINAAKVDVAVRTGERRILHRDGQYEQLPIAPGDPLWDWVAESAPAVQLNGRSAFETLEWIGRELGRPVIYRSAASREVANNEALIGMDRLTPQRALNTLPAITALKVTSSDSRIVVE